MNFKPLTVAAVLLSAGLAQATCFSVFKADGTIIQETSTTPVDLTLPIGDTVVAKFGPGTSMTISEAGFYCKSRGVPVAGRPQSLAEAVLAEEQKMLIKAPAATVAVALAKAEGSKKAVAKQDAPKTMAAKEDPNAATLHEDPAKTVVTKEDSAKTVMVKQDGTTTVVETRQGTVVKVKGKAKAKEKEAQ